MKHSRMSLLAVAAAAALTLSACGGDSGELVEDPGAEAEGGEDAGGQEGGAEDGEYDIALVSKGFQHQFWQAVQSGAEEKAEELGVTVTFDGPASETEIDAQLQMLRSAIERQPDAIGFAALDPEACVPLYEEAEAEDIPIVEFDAGCDSEIPLNISKTDSMVAGALAAEHMAELIGGEGAVGIVAHSQINSTGVERRDGFVNKMEEDYPDIEIVDVQYGDGDHLKSADIAKTMLAGQSDMAGLYGTNEGSAIGIVNAINELGMEPGEVTVVGFDSGQAQIEAIQSGVMAGLITQDPAGIGRATVESAVAAIEGEELEEVDTGSYWVDENNIDDEEIQAMLYE
ncbi:ABC transporter substrate-binding protein [Ornithinimicrobium sediminis]|uniref:ABC transporter substrate-binding protein n=1 Tax=Ornithinimicrobium sediminis TaxID=2904603 RepID=UPI001E2BE093|nr:ABC transporter substrate-binding protein [Ornithinimicrobium sediminis]MCE0487380.1 ABC transporter substrate-binding protein [Ornithinimicrobium sediminis]